MSIISIGVQSSSRDGGIGNIKIDLSKAFSERCLSTYCAAFDEYAIVIRVDGDMKNFGNEGITRLRFAKKQRHITADIQIPEKIWQPKSKNEIRDYIAQKVRECLSIFVSRIKKDRLIIDEEALFIEVDSAIGFFKSINYESSS